MNSNSVFTLMKFIALFNAIVAASFWLGMLWRRANRIGAWTSMLVTFVMTLLLPFTLPLLPGIRTSEYLLKQTDQPPVSRVYTARPPDVRDRQKAIDEWDRLNRAGQAIGSRPEPLVAGQRFEKWFKNASKSVFWAGDIEFKSGVRAGAGFLKVELVLIDLLGWDLSKNSYAINETISMSVRIIVPFATLMLVSLLTRREDKSRLDFFYAKMKTKVCADPVVDAHEMALSRANPHRFDHLKLFPNSNWEFRKWDRDDTKGVIGVIVAAGGCILLLWLIVTIGR